MRVSLPLRAVLGECQPYPKRGIGDHYRSKRRPVRAAIGRRSATGHLHEPGRTDAFPQGAQQERETRQRRLLADRLSFQHFESRRPDPGQTLPIKNSDVICASRRPAVDISRLIEFIGKSKRLGSGLSLAHSLGQ